MGSSDPAQESPPYPVSILIPVYGSEEHLRLCLQSLADFLPPGCDVYVLDDASPGDGVAQVVEHFAEILPALSYVRRPENLGFVGNCNEGMLALRDTGREILLLNSDTQVTKGAIEEMYAVLHAHTMHGVVTPRSNRATIYSVPVFEPVGPEESFALWTEIKPFLKRHQIMPTAVGFCMLVRNAMLHHFGVFDPIYSPGYNEENDFVCRINRRGYSAVAANRAYVFHFEGASFAHRRRALEQRNRAVLDQRYPEYEKSLQNYFRFHMDPVDRFAAVWTRRKKRIFFDLHHLTPAHSGTSEFGINLLLHLAPRLAANHQLIVGLGEPGRSFFESELIGYEIFDEARSQDAKFDLAFKPCQLFTWQELHRLTRLAARICLTHLDSIAVRCRYLSAPSTEILQRNLPDLVDRIITISRFSKADFEAFYERETDFRVIYLGAHRLTPIDTPPNGYVLIAGNHYEHKAVNQAVTSLEGLRKIVVLGHDAKSVSRPGVERQASGHLGRNDIHQLFANAAVVVYPSHYEGFGLPVLDSLALGRHVVVLDMPVSRELAELTKHTGRLHLVKTHREMRCAVDTILAELKSEGHVAVRPSPMRSWEDVACDYATAFEELLSRPVDVDRLRFRWNWLTAMDSWSALQ
jgi:GT2 family glycosyltransferase